jgi:hypothetical protein
MKKESSTTPPTTATKPDDFSHPTAAEFKKRFQTTANAIASRYAGKVWLVGGALGDDKPRDYDVRVVVEDEDAVRLGLDDEWNLRYENLKGSRNFSAMMLVNVDFQVQLPKEAKRYRYQPRKRLDDAPDSLFDAGR